MPSLLPGKIGEVLVEYSNDPSPSVRIAVSEALYRFGYRKDALEILEKELDRAPPFAKLRALNTLESLGISNLPDSLVQKINLLEENGKNNYVQRAAGEF